MTNRVISLVIALLALMGCSVTSLQCGVDGDSSFVNLSTTPQVLSQTSRQMGELCGFAYEEPSNGTQTPKTLP